MTTGIVTQHGPAVMHRGVVVQLPAEHTPLGAAVAAAVAAIDRGEVQPCPHCGAAGGCDCLDWLEWLAHADYPPPDEMTDEDLPL